MRHRLLIPAAVAAASALVVLLTVGQQWGSATVTGAARQHVTVTGRQVSAAPSALALAMLALAVAVVAARGLLRRAVAMVGTAVGLLEAVVAMRAGGDVMSALTARAFGVDVRLLPTRTTAWWIVAALAGILAAVAFCAVAVAGGRWQGMGARYDAPKAPAREKDPTVAAWEALDRGDDPTA
jgi:hypothetical protein